jgi:riboflavin kinase/FMN adenylyltransferase
LRNYEAKGFFEVKEIPVEQIDEVYISSSKIRKAIEQGQIAQANAYLGQPYQVSGHVSRGLQNGRSIGFPTANVQLTEAEKILPADGVYAVSSEYNGVTLYGMMNIGWRPTIKEAKVQRKIEVHFFDFQDDIYEAYLALSLHERIRSEQKFAGLEALKRQLQADEIQIRSYFFSMR